MQTESIDAMLLAARQQLYEYTFHLRLNGSLTADPYGLYAFHQQYQSRFRQQQPKPAHSYIGLIAMAILSSPERQLLLADIYQWILDHYPYFRSRGLGWRNSIRHNLSLNDCFIKDGRSTNGKGHYWKIHSANLADFLSGDFRRRRAQRRVRSSMGLSVADDDDEDEIDDHLSTNQNKHSPSQFSTNSVIIPPSFQSTPTPRKRCFDVASLLAPDQPSLYKRGRYYLDSPNSKSDGSTDTNISS